jgi:hypothetical protein
MAIPPTRRSRLMADRRQQATPLCPSMIAPAPRQHRSSPGGDFQSTPHYPDTAQPTANMADDFAPSRILLLFAHAGAAVITSRTRGFAQHVV